MKKRIFIYMALTSILAVVLSVIITACIYYYTALEQTKADVKNVTEYAKNVVLSSGWQSLGNIADSSNRVTLIKKDGTVIYDSVQPSKTMQNHADRPEFKGATEYGTGEQTRLSATISKQSYYYAVRLEDGNVLRLSRETDNIIMVLVGKMPLVALVALIVVIIELLVVGYFTKKIVNPINDIALESESPTLLYNELSPLVSKLNHQKQIINDQIKDLKQKQQEFSAITENMSEGFVIVDCNKNILSYNSSALEIFDVGNEIGNKNVLMLNRSAVFREAVELAIHGFKSQNIVSIGERSYDVIANPVYKSGRIQGAVIVVLDVTEREQREHLRREFAANVSHELKTPLTSISGFAEIMKTGVAKPEDTQRFSSMIYDEAARLIALVNDIIKLSVLDEGMSIEKVRANLIDEVKIVWAQLSSIAQKRSISCAIKGSNININANKQMLGEIIYNLLDNAIKYNVDGGKITVTISSDEQGAFLSVSDTGIGIASDEQQRVFERFYRVDKSHSKKIGGTGLGLSIVKNAAVVHNATLSLKSTLGKGTTVTIHFKQ
ncbi:MAG: ATP-binding protein [Oscillospiraceae bacterium]